MTDLRTKYLGLDLAHPVVASPSPLTKELDGVKRLEDGGASAVVMFSLFEEQLRAEQDAMEHLWGVGRDRFAEASTFFPPMNRARIGPHRYLELLRRARESCAIPVIASLNGTTDTGWAEYARELQQAGAHAIELNVYLVAADPREDGRVVEQRYLDVLAAVKAAVTIPVAIKVGPYFSSFANMAQRFEGAGADGLVLFNRFYQPDFDLERLQVTPSLELSVPTEARLPLMWIALLHGRVKASIAATTGVHSYAEVVKFLLAGADVAMTTGALLRYGPSHLRSIVDGLRDWMEAHHYGSVGELRGTMSRQRVSNPDAFERANYVRVLEDWRNPWAAE